MEKQVDVVIGLQRGDESKGRITDLLAVDYDIIARGNGGANAGHKIKPEGLEMLATHQIPSGIAYNGKMNVIGNGMYVDPVRLMTELDEARSKNYSISAANLKISNIAHLVLPHHVELDEVREDGDDAQGSTKRGIAFVAADKFLRRGVRVEDISDKDFLYNIAYEGLCTVYKDGLRKGMSHMDLIEKAEN